MNIRLLAAVLPLAGLIACVEYETLRTAGTFTYEGKEYTVVEERQNSGDIDYEDGATGFSVQIDDPVFAGRKINAGFCQKPLGSPECNELFGKVIRAAMREQQQQGGDMY